MFFDSPSTEWEPNEVIGFAKNDAKKGELIEVQYGYLPEKFELAPEDALYKVGVRFIEPIRCKATKEVIGFKKVYEEDLKMSDEDKFMLLIYGLFAFGFVAACIFVGVVIGGSCDILFY